MPLVTRTASQGNLFLQATEPTEWLNGDLWSDITANVLKLNVLGTATEIGGLELTFDNARLALTASQTDTTIPATGENDVVTYIKPASISGSDAFNISVDSGSNFVSAIADSVAGTDTFMNVAAGRAQSVKSIGNSTGRFQIVCDATVGTRDIEQLITTYS